LEDILARFDRAQEATLTLTARFEERKELSLLKEPVVSRGRFFFTKPGLFLGVDGVIEKYLPKKLSKLKLLLG